MKKGIVICLVSSLWLLAGCWDTHLLRDISLTFGIGFDAAEGDRIKSTSVVRQTKVGSGGTGRPTTTNVIYTTVANTPRETRINIEKQLGGEYAPNKMQVFLMGEELAKKDIYPVLDVFYRDPRNSLGAKIVITEGTAEEILSIQMSKEVFIVEKLMKTIQRSEQTVLIPDETIQSICADLLDPGKDFALPYIKFKQPDSFEITGVALFHDKKFTGNIIEGEDVTTLLYMNGDKSDFSRFTFKVNPEEARLQNQYVATNALLKNHSLKVNVDKQHNISVDINVKLRISAIEYPLDHLYKEEEIQRLNKEISKQLTEKAESVIKELQEANCDFFGIGRKVMAYHPDTWKEIDWAETFPTIDIKPKFEAEITGTGILK